MDHTQHFLSFQVGRQWYGIDVENVIEVSYLVMLNELTSSESGVLGLMTIRNEVIPVIDLRTRFGEPENQFELNTPIINVRSSKGLVGLVVDDVDNVETISGEQQMEYSGTEFVYIQRVAKQTDRLLLLVNPDHF